MNIAIPAAEIFSTIPTIIIFINFLSSFFFNIFLLIASSDVASIVTTAIYTPIVIAKNAAIPFNLSLVK